MKMIQSVSYYLMVVLVDLGLLFLECLGFSSLIEMYISSLIIRVLIYSLLILIINPVITYYICNKVNIKIDGYKKEEIYAVHPEES